MALHTIWTHYLLLHHFYATSYSFTKLLQWAFYFLKGLLEWRLIRKLCDNWWQGTEYFHTVVKCAILCLSILWRMFKLKQAANFLSDNNNIHLKMQFKTENFFLKLANFWKIENSKYQVFKFMLWCRKIKWLHLWKS